MSLLDEEKLFYAKFPERFSSLHDDAQLVSVYENFGIEVFRRSAVLEGFDAFLRANRFEGQRIVEIGTCMGLTAIVLARYFNEVVTIDNAPNEKKRVIAEFLGVENIRFIDVADNTEKARVINGLQFDAAFSDGDHASDTESDFALVGRCGRVLFHEYWPVQPPVYKMVDCLRFTGKVVTENKWALWIA